MEQLSRTQGEARARDPHTPTPASAPPMVSPKGLVVTCSMGGETGQGEVRHLSVGWLVCYLAMN